jgi:hypothetical protein
MRFTDPSATVSGFATKPCESVVPDQDPNLTGGRRGWGARRIGKERDGTDMRVVLAPSLALLREAAARDPSSRHGRRRGKLL